MGGNTSLVLWFGLGLLLADYGLAAIRAMTSKGMRTPEQDFLGGRLERYEQTIADSLTLKPFPGTISRDGDEVVFTVTLTPPETAVIRIGPDTFQPLENRCHNIRNSHFARTVRLSYPVQTKEDGK